MRVRRWSIAWRLALGLSAGMALFWLAAVAIAISIMQAELNRSFDEVLRQSGLRLLPLAHELAENDSEALPGQDRGRRPLNPVGVLDSDEGYFTYYVRDEDNELVVRAEDAPGDFPIADVRDGFSEVEGRRVFAATDPRHGYSIIVVERDDQRRRAIAGSLAALALPLAALIPLMVLGIWYAVRLGMRPVQRLSQDIALRGGRNLAPPDAAGQPVELAPIAEEVAALLDRLRAALDAERAFAASSAHELRTPIAGALAQTQQLASELAGNPRAERIKDIESGLKNLSQLAEQLLQLSRLEAGFARIDTASDLLPVLSIVVRDFQSALATRDRVTLDVAEGTRLIAAINPDAFAIAIRNLVQNALMHGTPGSTVSIKAGPGATVLVANDGGEVPAATLERLGDPFVRGKTPASGTGLGLSIVRSILDQTGGRLSLRSPRTGRSDGFEAELSWASP